MAGLVFLRLQVNLKLYQYILNKNCITFGDVINYLTLFWLYNSEIELLFK